LRNVWPSSARPKKPTRVLGAFLRHQVGALADRFFGGITENLFGGSAPKENATIGVGADDGDRRGIDDGCQSIFGLSKIVGRVARLLLTLLKPRGHLVEPVSQDADFIIAPNGAAVVEVAGGQHRGVLSELPQRTHDAPRQHPGNDKRRDQRAGDEQGVPDQRPHHRGVGDIGGQTDRDEPGNLVGGRGAGNALNVIRPRYDLADLFRCEVLRDVFHLAEIATDPVQIVRASGNANALLVNDLDEAAGGKPLHSQRVLEMIEQRADGEHGL
jgi:hypothetical protein